MKPNIIFLVVDGLRSDQAYGNKKETITPNLDSIIKKGVFFKNSHSSADGTNLSLNCIFNSLFPCKTNTRAKKIILKENNIFELLKENQYQIFGLVPKIINFQPVIDLFQNTNNVYSYIDNTKTLDSGLTNEIISILKSGNDEKPGLFYFHVMDIHPDREGKYRNGSDKELDFEISDMNYINKISSIDKHLGEIFSEIDFTNSLLILCSDHGDRIPFENIKNIDFEPKLGLTKEIGKKVLPTSFHKIGGNTLSKIRKGVADRKIKHNKKKLTSHQSRSRESYFVHSLFDELLHIPLLFVGEKLKPKIISELVSHVDIFPTICDYIEIKNTGDIDGRNLIPLINNEKIDEIPIYLHTIPYEEPSPTDAVGIRTSKFKYFRSEHDNKKNVHLYNLEDDPLENNNIFSKHPEIISNFEKIISKLEKDKVNEEIIDDEKLVKEELKKLGYI